MIANKLMLAIDFDGTIVDHQFPEIGELRPNAVEVINKLYNEGHEITIWTCREGEDLEKAKQFLIDNGIPFHRFNANRPDQICLFNNDCRKVYADIYIDDRQVGGLPKNWEVIYLMVLYHRYGSVETVIVDLDTLLLHQIRLKNEPESTTKTSIDIGDGKFLIYVKVDGKWVLVTPIRLAPL